MGSEEAEQANAIWHSLIKSCLRRKIPTWQHLFWIFGELPKVKVTAATIAWIRIHHIIYVMLKHGQPTTPTIRKKRKLTDDFNGISDPNVIALRNRHTPGSSKKWLSVRFARVLGW